MILQKRAAPRRLGGMAAMSPSQTQLRVSLQRETFLVATHLSLLRSLFYLTGETAREAKSMMGDKESRKASKIQTYANLVPISNFLPVS